MPQIQTHLSCTAADKERGELIGWATLVYKNREKNSNSQGLKWIIRFDIKCLLV